METDLGFPMRLCCCSVEWQAIYSNLVKYDRQLHNDDRDAASLFKLLSITLLSPRVFSFFLSKLKGCSYVLTSYHNLTSLFLDSISLIGETKTVILEEAVLGEEKSYSKLVRSEADFCILSILSSFTLEVLSN